LIFVRPVTFAFAGFLLRLSLFARGSALAIIGSMISDGRNSLAEQADPGERPQALPVLVSVQGSMLVDVRGAARLVGLSPRSLYKLISGGKFPEGRPYPSAPGFGEKARHRVAWRVDEIVDWVNDHFARRETD
jgi:predicted DNA-binding transcriptional regulator AlpA